MEILQQYLNERYVFFLIGVLLLYIAAWFITFMLARPVFNIVTAGNPYKKICNCWQATFLGHTILVISVSLATCKMMYDNNREPSEIFVYNIGFILCLLFDLFVLGRLRRKKAELRY